MPFQPESNLIDRSNEISNETLSGANTKNRVGSLFLDIAESKVQKDGLKVLSDTNFTLAEKTKLSGIESGATANATNAQLRDRATHTGSQAISTVTGLQSALDNKADLINGVIPTSQIPVSVATDTFVVNTQAAMLALSANRGDIAVRTDVKKNFILQAEPATTLSNWVELESPADAVTSVNGQTGLVVLSKGDVGLSNVDNTSDVNKPVSTAQQTALNGKANTSHTHVIADVTGLQASLDGKAPISNRFSALIIETDFYNTGTPFAQGLVGSAVSSGTIVAIASEPNHPGVVALRDSTTANGGYRIMTDVSAFRIAGGERFVASFQVNSARAGIAAYLGFFDSTTNTAPTDALCLVITANGTTASIVGRGRANNTASDTSAFNPTLNTWYTVVIDVNSAATNTTFEIFNESGTSVWSGSTTNIPTGAGRETGVGAAAYESSIDAAADIIRLDYMRIEVNRNLTR